MPDSFDPADLTINISASVSDVVRAAAMDEGELYPCRLGVFCDHCEDTFEGDFIVSIHMSKTERLAVVRSHVVKTMGWRCDKQGDFCSKLCRDNEIMRRQARHA